MSDTELDYSFQSGSGFDSMVYVTQVQTDGKVVVGGSFTNYNGVARKFLARLHSDGSLDTSFDANNSLVSVAIPDMEMTSLSLIALQPNGKLLVTLNFVQHLTLTAATKLVRLNSDGTLDNSFSSGVSYGPLPVDVIRALNVQADGKILAGGSFTNYAGQQLGPLVRLNSDGSLDTSFTPAISAEASDRVDVIAVLGNGKIVIGGSFKLANETVTGLVRLNSDGSLDSSFAFDGGFNNFLRTMLVQPDGKFVVAGSFSTVGQASRPLIARFNADGTLDNSFNANFITEQYPTATALAVQSDGKLIVSGSFTLFEVLYRNRLVRLNSDGTLDPSFTNTDAILGKGITTLAVQNDDKVVVGGSFQSYNGQPRSRLVRLAKDGTLDDAFNTGRHTGADGYVNSIVALPSGKTLIGGSFTSYNGVRSSGVARLNSDGTVDSSFTNSIGTGAQGDGVKTVAVQPDGKIILGGTFVKFNGFASRRLVRLSSDGSIDTSFKVAGGGFDTNEVGPILVQPDGKILVGGYFNSFAGQDYVGVVRLNSDGSLDPSVNLKFGGVVVQSFGLQSDGKILIGGRFTSVNGQPHTNLIRINANGTLDNSFSPTFDLAGGAITAIVVQPDGKIIAGGYRAPTTSSYVILKRFNSDGTLDLAFGLDSKSAYVNTLVLQDDGKLLVGGQFATYSGQPVTNGLLRINPDGTLDNEFTPSVLSVWSLALQADKKILIGGAFTAVNGYTRDNVARLGATPCDPLVVTNITDDGKATQCGTLSYALANTTSGTISFSLISGNTLTFSGSLTPTLSLSAGVALDGGASGVILDGSAVAGDGLHLGGANMLTNLTIRGFSGQALIARAGASPNHFYRVKVEK